MFCAPGGNGMSVLKEFIMQELPVTEQESTDAATTLLLVPL